MFRRVAPRLKRIRRPAALIGGCFALVAMGVIVVWPAAFTGERSAENDSDVVAAPTQVATPTPEPEIERLIIPSINVDVPVTSKVVEGDGDMPSPVTPEEVIWYDFSALPGLGGRPGTGNTVLAGHVDYHDYGPGVFWNLRDVKMGDEIKVVLEDGSEYSYTTKSNRVVDPAAMPFTEVVASTPEESLTVITCAGDFDPATDDYNLRRVVWAVRAG